MKRRAVLLLGSLFVVLPSTAVAQQKAPAASIPDSRIFARVTESDLEALVRAEGDTIDAMHPFDGPSVRAKTPEGTLYLLIGTACDDTKSSCLGVMMQVRYDDDERVNFERINEANLQEAAVTTWWDPESDTVGFQRYIVLDDGVTWLNLRQNVRVLLDVSNAASDIVFP